MKFGSVSLVLGNIARACATSGTSFRSQGLIVVSGGGKDSRQESKTVIGGG